MTRIFLTGGSGFIATHILDILLKQGHSVVTSARSEAKAQAIKKSHPEAKKESLDFVVVEDIAVEGAFDEAIKSDPPFETVIHTSSPFHYNITDIQKDFLDPAIIGTTGLLKAIKKSAPTVKRVVITSSFAAIFDPKKGNRPGYNYSEKDWSPITVEDAEQDPQHGYRASKIAAEKASWEFVETQEPNFTLATCCPPLVFGPVQHLTRLDSINASNIRIRDIAFGASKTEIKGSSAFIWTDVRDVALAPVAAAELPGAANKRFFITAGRFDNGEIVDIIRDAFPDLAGNLPGKDAKGLGSGEEIFSYDNSRTVDVLGIKFRSLKESVIDTVKSLQAIGS